MDTFSLKSPISSFAEIRPVGAALMLADRQMDMKKVFLTARTHLRRTIFMKVRATSRLPRRFFSMALVYSCYAFLGAFEKLRKATTNFVISVCLFVSPSVRMKRKSSPIGRIPIKLGIWEFFENLSEKNQVLLKSDNNNWLLCVFMIICDLIILEWEMFQIKIKTHILCSITFFRKSCRSWDNVEKYGTARQTTEPTI